jgi:hypothetical protein
MRGVPSPAETQAAVDAQLARVNAMFDAVFADAKSLIDNARSAGLLRDPHSRTRVGDPPPALEQAA